MALGAALFEQVTLDHGQIAHPALASPRVPRLSDIPGIDVELRNRPDIPPAGAGQTPLITGGASDRRRHLRGYQAPPALPAPSSQRQTGPAPHMISGR